jgi:hypothetical protein
MHQPAWHTQLSVASKFPGIGQLGKISRLMEYNNPMEHRWECGRRIMGEQEDYTLAYCSSQERGGTTEMGNDLELSCCYM